MDKKAIFRKAYANLPLGARREIVAVIDGEPMTWQAIWIEIDQNTIKCEKILNYLFELKILQNETK
jgi:hypothetical protein